MEEKNKFDNLFQGVGNVLNEQENQLEETKKLNSNLKQELTKMKMFNIVMLVIALISLVITLYFGIR